MDYYKDAKNKPHENLKYPRPEERVRIEFESRVPTSIPGSPELYRPGKKHTAVIYRSDLERAEAKVETNEGWALYKQAETAFQKDFEKEMERQTKNIIDEFEKQRQMAHAKTEYTNSVEAEFYNMSRQLEDGPRGLKPLKYVEVVEELDPPKPETLEYNEERDRKQYEMLREIFGNQSKSDENAELKKRLEETEKRLEALLQAQEEKADKSKLGPKPKK